MTMVINMKTVPAGEFKAKCLKLMDYVNETHLTIVITKHNKPIALLTPVTNTPSDVFGCMKNTVTVKFNIVDPIDVTWDASDE